MPRRTMILLLGFAAACYSETETEQADCSSETQLAEARTQKSNDPMALTACPLILETSVGSPIQVAVSLINVADSVIVLQPSFDFGAWLDATIVGPDGAALKRVGFIDPGFRPKVALVPGEQIEAIIDLRCGFQPEEGEDPGPQSCMAPYKLEAPGEYAVTMRYTYGCGTEGCPSDLLPIGEVEAPTFHFTLR